MRRAGRGRAVQCHVVAPYTRSSLRSEEHTSELQSQSNLVCRLLLEKKKPSPRHTPLVTHSASPNILPPYPQPHPPRGHSSVRTPPMTSYAPHVIRLRQPPYSSVHSS